MHEFHIFDVTSDLVHHCRQIGCEGLPFVSYFYSKIYYLVGGCVFVVRIGSILNILVLFTVNIIITMLFSFSLLSCYIGFVMKFFICYTVVFDICNETCITIKLLCSYGIALNVVFRVIILIFTTILSLLPLLDLSIITIAIFFNFNLQSPRL